MGTSKFSEKFEIANLYDGQLSSGNSFYCCFYNSLLTKTFFHHFLFYLELQLHWQCGALLLAHRLKCLGALTEKSSFGKSIPFRALQSIPIIQNAHIWSKIFFWKTSYRFKDILYAKIDYGWPSTPK